MKNSAMGLIVVVIVLLAIPAFCVGPIGLYLYTHETNPITQKERQAALEQQQWKYLQEQRQALQEEERWAPVRDSAARVAGLAWPTLGVLVALSLAAGGALGFSYLTTRAKIALVHQANFVYPDKRGAYPLAVNQALTTDVTNNLALVFVEKMGQAAIERAANMALGVDWGSMQGLRNLSLKGGTQHSRLPAPRPVAQYALPEPEETRMLPTGAVTLDALTDGTKFDLPFGLDEAGNQIYRTLAGLYNFLIAGATRSGKTNLMRAQLEYLIQNHTPQELQLVIIDPKRTEFSPFLGAPHILEHATAEADWVRALDMVEAERDRRQQIVSKWTPDDIERHQLPLMIVVIDELFDVCKSGHLQLTGITGKCLSAGICVVAASQLPERWQIPSALLANLTARACGHFPTHHESTQILGFSATKWVFPGSHLFMTNFEGRGPVVRPPVSRYTTTVPTVQPTPRVISGNVVPSLPALTDEQRILSVVDGGPVMKSAIYAEFDNKKPEVEINDLLRAMMRTGQVVMYFGKSTGGRRPEMVALPTQVPDGAERINPDGQVISRKDKPVARPKRAEAMAEQESIDAPVSEN